MKLGLLFGTITAFAASLCFAGESISDQTKCRAVRLIFDANPPDMSQVRDVATAIDRQFRELDKQNSSKGKAQIYERMSAKGKNDTSAVVTVRCEDHPDETLKIAAESVYKMFEAMGDTMGVNQ